MTTSSEPNRSAIETGVGAIDITPDYPIHLSGYAVRQEECYTVEQRLRASAMAIGNDREGVSLLLTVDNTGVPAHVTEAVFQRLRGESGLVRENFAVCSTHTHHSPMVTGVLPNLFSRDIPGPEQERIDRYTAELVEKLEQVARAAMADRRPAHLLWARGGVTFARNRRTEGGPVDHTLPLLCVRSPEGKTRAVFTRYTCHCTTLKARENTIHGDWAGEAREAIEADHPGAIAMLAVGCAGDQGPHPQGSVDLARQHGRSVAGEVSRLLGEAMWPLPRKPTGHLRHLQLPFEPLPTRAEWEARAGEGDIVGYHARKNLARLDRGEALPETLAYSVQSWLFGDDLNMVFLPGEVVVDYQLRLQRELGSERLWINAYANDVPCYIPSRRILREGGYEAETSLWYYDQPARLAPDAEDLIVNAVFSLLQPSGGDNINLEKP